MTITCLKCDGSGELECEHCNQSRDCPDCDGHGEIDCCVTEFTVPEKHKNRDALLILQADAKKCKSDHAYLVKINPRAKDSYDSQLAITLEKINSQSEKLLK